MRGLVVLLLVLPTFPLAEGDACVVESHEHRQQAGYWVAIDERVCSERASARHTLVVRVTEGPPGDNRSIVLALVLYEHDRAGDRAGAHTIREHAQARVGSHWLDTWYNSTRTADGYTSCTVYANATHPRGNATARNSLPACVPHEALQP